MSPVRSEEAAGVNYFRPALLTRLAELAAFGAVAVLGEGGEGGARRGRCVARSTLIVCHEETAPTRVGTTRRSLATQT
jgi:hypothetical protein